MSYYVYILASRMHGTLYVGVTNDIARRVCEHKEKCADAFTAKHGVDRLVHMEIFEDIQDAIAQEKRLKKSARAWKVQLIERQNPEWRDLYEDLNA